MLLRGRKYVPTLAERCGQLPSSWQQTAHAAIWLHAVSVGEVIACVPLVTELAARNPGVPLFLSTGTTAGRETAEKRLAGKVTGIFFAPIDYVWIVRRVLRRLRPSTLVILETEIWPNLIREARRLGCGVAIVNGRISDRALPRYRRWSGFFGPVLALCDRILTQSDEMRERYLAAGAPPAITANAGNLKYDFTAPDIAPDSPALRWLASDNTLPIWIAASTTADAALAEEDFVLAAQRQLHGWRLILAPRQPARFEAAAAKLAASGLRWTRRSALEDPAADILLLDSIGELAVLFAHAQVVFMGGTVAALGGHNILEPASFGKPVIAGPHLENFRDIEQHFTRRNAFLRIATPDQLPAAILAAAADPALGERARAAANEERGATARVAASITELAATHCPATRAPQPQFAFFWFFARLWQFFSARDRRAKQRRQRRLPVPVVSIGNITAGGTGKTPVTIELLRDLADLNPGLLTRGHGRSTSDTVLMLAGSPAPPLARTGDEAQLIFRASQSPIGIAADRFTAGTELLHAASPKLLLLDDGFQHLQLYRDFDLVLIDALHPFGDNDFLPLGRLREPLAGLARASAFLITRSAEVPDTRAIEAVLRRYNPQAPVFHARTRLLNWTNCNGAEYAPHGLASRKIVAFCGLGNPASFWKSLETLGLTPLAKFAWEDHHRYKPADLRRLTRHARDLGADTLVTTAKDIANLSTDCRTALAPLELFYLAIDIEIDRRDELIALIRQATGLH